MATGPPPPSRTTLDLDSRPEARARAGKEARARTSRSSHGEWSARDDRGDPIDLLRQQAAVRVTDLVPIRHGRMSESPLAFYRGAAVVMAMDLASGPRSGLDVQLCGDAHLANFGGFASPERSLVFDVNDFDETLPGPFEWDVKRLAASVEIAARSLGFDEPLRRRIVGGSVRSYRETIRRFATMARLDVWYARLDVDVIRATWGAEVGGTAIARFRRSVERATSKDRLRAKAKLTRVVDGDLLFTSDPPLLVPARDLLSESDQRFRFETVDTILGRYRQTLNEDRRHLLDGYRLVDLARKVVGVGSVGTRCWVALLVGRDNDDPLFLQVKEAEASVLERFLEPSRFDQHGQRVVEGQRLMQAAGDLLLGWQRVEGLDGRPHDYYVRQLWDWKASADIATMEPAMLDIYAQLCGWTLARSHARSGDPIAIGAYLGNGPVFDDAVGRFAAAYADQNERDHQRLLDAIAAGVVQATTGI